MLEKGELLILFPPTDTTITTHLPLHGLSPFRFWYSPLGFADRLAHVDHVASKQNLGTSKTFAFLQEGSLAM
jgi:hypothetical protein